MTVGQHQDQDQDQDPGCLAPGNPRTRLDQRRLDPNPGSMSGVRTPAGSVAPPDGADGVLRCCGGEER